MVVVSRSLLLGFGPLVPVYKEDGSLSGPLKDGAQMNNPVALINDRVVDKFRNYFSGYCFPGMGNLERLEI